MLIKYNFTHRKQGVKLAIQVECEGCPTLLDNLSTPLENLAIIVLEDPLNEGGFGALICLLSNTVNRGNIGHLG